MFSRRAAWRIAAGHPVSEKYKTLRGSSVHHITRGYIQMESRNSTPPQAGHYGGYTSLTPHIVVSPAHEALEFYVRTFGAEVLSLTAVADRVLHALLDFGQGKLTLSDPRSGSGLLPPDENGRAVYSLAVYVPNVDEAISAALEGGAEMLDPIENYVSGDRLGSIIDPFGVHWSILTRIEDLFLA